MSERATSATRFGMHASDAAAPSPDRRPTCGWRARARLPGGRGLGPVLSMLLAAGCATTPNFDTAVVVSTELADVPFFPQTDYQCGPAALATILAYEGLPVGAEDLAPAVYVDGLRGSLQAELKAATRRYGLVPFEIEPNPAALFAEVASGEPVLVLQNLGVRRLPIWHYAVVVGYDASRDEVLLRSGTERRRRERLGRFLRSWERAGHWGFVASRPDAPPATATATRYLRALNDTAPLLEPGAADAAFSAAVARWPDDPLALFAAAGRHADAERWDAAAAAYATLVEMDPGHAAAHNNLAHVLAQRGCHRAALREAQTALQLTGTGDPLRAAIEDTVTTLSATSTPAAEPGDCAA